MNEQIELLSYTLRDFDYHLPEELIAQQPVRPRDHSRLLIYDRESGRITDDYFYHIGRYLPPGATLVANNSRVEKCRLLFDGGSKEIFVVNALNDKTVEALVRPGKKFRKGKTVAMTKDIDVEVTDVSEDGIRTLSLGKSLNDPSYDEYRATPFPPYVMQDESLASDYQTVFAQNSGSKAAPTAGLHFTEALIKELKESGYAWEEITLHVGLGTFAPVKTEDLNRHNMHSEWYQIDKTTSEGLSRATHRTAIGTTSVRVLESAAGDTLSFRPCSGTTDIFIRPGYSFKTVDTLITNFHLPKSTLLMLVSAFMGFDEMHRVYEHAIRRKYRFYSFGDAMMIL